MPERVRGRPDRPGDEAPSILPAPAAAKLTDFARACRAAARAVSLYPAGHPAVGSTLDRLASLSSELTSNGSFSVQVLADRLLLDGAGLATPDPAVSELGALLHRHLLGRLSVNQGAGADSWHTFLLLVARSPEDARNDGGLAHLWDTAGGPSIEVQEIDYAEVLREKQGLAETIEEVLAAAMAGPEIRIDDRLARLIEELVIDPARAEALMRELERLAGAGGPDGVASTLLRMLRAVVQQALEAGRTDLDTLMRHFGDAAAHLSPAAMCALLDHQRSPDAVSAGRNVLAGIVEHMSERAVVGFVAASVVAERGATGRIAHAFSALVPDVDKRRQLLGLAGDEVARSALGDDVSFPELWQGVETMLGSYSDATFVSTDYARELSNARTQPIDIDAITDDPEDRIAGWLATVADAALRALDRELLVDLLTIETDPLRWRDMAATVVTHVDDLVRVGHFDQAWELLGVVVAQGAAVERQPHVAAALARFGQSAMMKHVSAHLRTASDDDCRRFTELCHAIGTPVIAPLAGALSDEPDARSRRRLRDILVGFGQRGRESVQQLMNAPNWEVRRTAAYLLREFGGAEGLKELIPLLSDPEPLVQREAVQGLVLNGTSQASEILLGALTRAPASERDRLGGEILAVKDDRAAPVLCHLLRRLDRRALPGFYLSALDALSASTSPEAVGVLDAALTQRDWRTPLRNRRFRSTAAQALRMIGTPDAIDALNAAARSGALGTRIAARAELARVG